VRGPAEQRAGRPALGDPAQVEHGGLLAQLADDGEVVGDQEVRQVPLRPQPADQRQDRRLRAHVERAGRLVEHQQTRLDCQRAGDCDALALAPGQLVGKPVGVLGLQAHRRQQLRHPGRPGGLLDH